MMNAKNSLSLTQTIRFTTPSLYSLVASMLIVGASALAAQGADSAPVARTDFALVGPTPALIPVLKNDSDGSGSGGLPAGLRIKSVSKPHRGTATVAGNVIIYRPGAFFDEGDSFSYTIVNSAGQEASASVVVGSWKYVGGSFVLNIPPDSGLPNGRVALTITAPGTYTASVTLRNADAVEVRRFSGLADATGELTLNLGRRGVLALSLSGREWGTGEMIPAVFRDKTGNTIASLFLKRPVVYDGFYGKYTLAGAGNNYAGWAVFQIAKSARVTIAGRLSNGMPFSAGAHVSDGADFNFFFDRSNTVDESRESPNGKVISGRVSLNVLPPTIGTGGGFIDYGATTLLPDTTYEKFPITVSRYTPPGARAPWFPSSNLKIVVGRPEQTPVLESTATLAGDRATVLAPFDSLVFQRSASGSTSPEGTFRGRLTLPGESSPRRFSGVMLQSSGKAVGFVEGYRRPGITITSE